MKFVKLSILTLTLGFFVASCGNGGGEADKKTDTATAAPAPPPAAPAPAMDTTKKMDTAKAAMPAEKK